MDEDYKKINDLKILAQELNKISEQGWSDYNQPLLEKYLNVFNGEGSDVGVPGLNISNGNGINSVIKLRGDRNEEINDIIYSNAFDNYILDIGFSGDGDHGLWYIAEDPKKLNFFLNSLGVKNGIEINSFFEEGNDYVELDIKFSQEEKDPITVFMFINEYNGKDIYQLLFHPVNKGVHFLKNKFNIDSLEKVVSNFEERQENGIENIIFNIKSKIGKLRIKDDSLENYDKLNMAYSLLTNIFNKGLIQEDGAKIVNIFDEYFIHFPEDTSSKLDLREVVNLILLNNTINFSKVYTDINFIYDDVRTGENLLKVAKKVAEESEIIFD